MLKALYYSNQGQILKKDVNNLHFDDRGNLFEEKEEKSLCHHSNQIAMFKLVKYTVKKTRFSF